MKNALDVKQTIELAYGIPIAPNSDYSEMSLRKLRKADLLDKSATVIITGRRKDNKKHEVFGEPYTDIGVALAVFKAFVKKYRKPEERSLPVI